MNESKAKELDAVRDAARALIEAALPVLATRHLFPRPDTDPFITVGSDYFGTDFASPEHAALERAISEAHPRFQEDTPLGERDFAHSYTYSFVEACVARLAFAKDPWALEGPEVEQSVDELVAQVLHEESEVACCRVVSHFTTVDGRRHRLGDIDVVPMVEQPAGHKREVREAIASVIAGSGLAFRGNDVADAWAPPESVLIARNISTEPFDAATALSRKLNTFLLSAQLLHGGTAQSMYEVQGETSMVRRFRPTIAMFRGQVGLMSSTQMVRRDLVIGPEDETRFIGLNTLMTRARAERPGMVVDSFGLAIHRFQGSYYAVSPYDQVVDLTTALEAAMAGASTSDVLLRLRTRCAALLATDNDPAGPIFDDVGKLYGLRSTLVHGGEMKAEKLVKLLASLTYAPTNAPFGEAFGHAVDRLRDLVRRSILARICLAGDEHPLWLLGANVAVDRELADDVTRARWRTVWHATLDGIGASFAANRPVAARSYLSSFSDRPDSST